MRLTAPSFLPNTISFNEEPPKDVHDDSPHPSGPPTRASSFLDLATRSSSTSLLALATEIGVSPSALYAAAETTLDRQTTIWPAEPGSLLSSDTLVEWGARIHNQPRSRAGQFTSSSINDFAKYAEAASEPGRRGITSRPSTRKSSPSQRGGSTDRAYEGKSWAVKTAVHGNGGLVNAIRAIADDGPDHDTTWIGTIGCHTDALPTSTKAEIRDKMINEYQSEVVFCSDKDIDGLYDHYCKMILWPIFHYQVPDHVKSKAYADHSWNFYRNVNQAIADRVVASYKRGDSIWIHDYHLLLVPGMVRKKLPEAKIGFFLHTAFPSSEIFRCLPTRKHLLEGMLGADLIGFQVQEHVTHFLQTCSRLLTVETTVLGVQLENHFVNVYSEPVGITPSLISEAREDSEVHEWIEKLKARFAGKRLIVARDKLDSVRGVRQKLLAYEMFLANHPEWREHVVLFQVATPTTEHTEELAAATDIEIRIRSTYGSFDHQPLVILQQDIDLPSYLALLSVADALMISALREGMGLAPHEFTLCQDGLYGGKKHAPIILSEFAGSADVLGKHAMVINPWDLRGQAKAISKALEMGAKEKEQRWLNLLKIVNEQTGARWAIELTKMLDKVHAEHHQHASSAVPRLSITALCQKYEASTRRLFIIDYEGTLAPHQTAQGIPLGSPVRVTEVLSELMADPKNTVYVMSGRQPKELERHFRMLSKVGLIAENGCYIREYAVEHSLWIPFVDTNKTETWKAEIRGMLKYYQDRLEGSYIEERQTTVVFRYDKATDPDAATRVGGECMDQINTAGETLHIRAVPVHQAILIEQSSWNKETAADYILDTHRLADPLAAPPDFLLVAGDDREDEVIFRWANTLADAGAVARVFTVTLGSRNTEARASITQGTTGLLNALQKLANLSRADALTDRLAQL